MVPYLQQNNYFKMEIIARRGYGGLYYVPAYLSSPCLNELALIRFAIDTGATITSVSSVDAVMNGIDCSKLQSLSPTFSATTPNIRSSFISSLISSNLCVQDTQVVLRVLLFLPAHHSHFYTIHNNALSLYLHQLI